MAIDFGKQVYLPAFNIFARSAVFTPVRSQPSQPSYTGRGIFGTQALDIGAEDSSVFSDQVTIFDVIETEFSVIPIQGDLISIPADLDLPALGDFEIVDSRTNGGGQTTYNLRKIVVSKP